MNKITLKDIAREAGVSQMTVSRVLNERPDVNPVTRKNIKAIVERLGYIPDANARALKGAKTNRIGVVVSDIRNPFYSELVGELEDIAGNKGLSVIVSDTNKKLETELTAIRMMELNSVDYLIIAPEGYRTDHLDQLQKKGMKFLSFGVHFEDKDYPEVWTDDYEGGRAVGMYLGSLGLKKPLLLMGNPRKTNTIDRETGFIAGFEEVGGNPSDIRLEHLKVNTDTCEAFLEEDLKERSFDSIFCYNDLMAMGVFSAFRKLGITAGKDIPLIGYDDVFYAKILGLTTVRIPIDKMLQESVDIIINDKKTKVEFKPELIIRETA
ncbi:MAG TPA: LacI family DNA-binding transcriptional regulator [Thermotogota bacterium]|nr:LacI family DNA-binding transcriptional regulator [Thermotogota bacterium]HPR97146.1 LacI family DNA-binding transcriptional regulator [Thermotogota bacterium]